MFGEKIVTIEATDYDEAYEKARDEYLFEILKKGAKYGWPVTIEYGGFKPYCVKSISGRTCIDEEYEFIKEGEFDIKLEELVPYGDSVHPDTIDFIQYIIKNCCDK